MFTFIGMVCFSESDICSVIDCPVVLGGVLSLCDGTGTAPRDPKGHMTQG